MIVHRTTMVDGRRRPWQPPPPWRNPSAQTMAAMEIFGRISQRHYTEPLNKFLDKSGLAGFCEKYFFAGGLTIYYTYHAESSDHATREECWSRWP